MTRKETMKAKTDPRLKMKADKEISQDTGIAGKQLIWDCKG
jgi:hypothetical protein